MESERHVRSRKERIGPTRSPPVDLEEEEEDKKIILNDKRNLIDANYLEVLDDCAIPFWRKKIIHTRRARLNLSKQEVGVEIVPEQVATLFETLDKEREQTQRK